MRKHIINAVIGVTFATVFMFLTLRNKPLDDIFSLLGNARTGWIFASMVFLGLIFLLRSLRWQLFLSNNGHNAPLKHVAYSLLLGSFVNAFTPKLGEVIRCTSLEKSTGIQTSRVMGTAISDRVWDIIILITGVILVLIIESERLGSLIAGSLSTMFSSLGDSIVRILAVVFITAAILFALWFMAKRFGLAERIRNFGRGVASTAKTTFRIKRVRSFALYTLIIWVLMILMNYACLKALPTTDNLSMYFAIVVLFIGTLGWAIPAPAGIGTSHFFVLQIFILFGLSEKSGVAYGILVNGVQVIITLAAGSVMVAAVYIYRLINQRKKGTVEQ